MRWVLVLRRDPDARSDGGTTARATRLGDSISDGSHRRGLSFDDCWAALSDWTPGRWSFCVALAVVVAAIGGYWFGGDPRPLPGVADLAFVFLIALVVGAIPGRRFVARTCASLFVLVVFVGSWVAGTHEASVAFNECVAECEAVRDRLDQYRATSGAYPESLAELGPPLPGARILRGPLLDYSRRGAGYVLEFGDWMVTHTASDSEPCFARK